MLDCGVEPIIKLIRGFTDGPSSLAWLPCPNLFTGGYNYHYGKHEFASQDVMEEAVQVINPSCLATLTALRTKGAHAKPAPAAGQR